MRRLHALRESRPDLGLPRADDAARGDVAPPEALRIESGGARESVQGPRGAAPRMRLHWEAWPASPKQAGAGSSSDGSILGTGKYEDLDPGWLESFAEW
jgi:hypothetical protein